MQKLYTVWVGGIEVNDHLLTRKKALALAMEYIDNDYDDVIVVCESRETLQIADIIKQINGDR